MNNTTTILGCQFLPDAMVNNTLQRWNNPVFSYELVIQVVKIWFLYYWNENNTLKKCLGITTDPSVSRSQFKKKWD